MTPLSETLDAPAVQRRADATPVDVAVVIPAFNEEKMVFQTVERVRSALQAEGRTFEIVVVDDGSTDRTAEEAERSGARVIRQGKNIGYGAALKAGITATRSEWVVIIDADGTYPEDLIPVLLARADDADMVVGARNASSAAIPMARKPAKRFLTWLASYLANEKIPDLNSGLRVFRRTALIKFLPLLPSGYSFTTTITLSMLCSNHRVVYVPIEYRERVGSSKLRAKEFPAFIVLVLRTVVLFNPLRVFLPLGTILFVGGFLKLCYDIVKQNLSESAVMAFLAAIMIWSVGLLADMISRLQLRPPDAA